MIEPINQLSHTCKTNRGERLIFIGGAPRSGTTLVQNILDSHPDICGGPEFLLLREIIYLRREIHQNIGKEFLSALCSHEEADQKICSLIENFFLPLANQNNCKFYSEKTPENILVFSELIELFPASHFIYVVRDPRAVVSSLLQVGKRAQEKGRNRVKYIRNIKNAIAHTKNCLDSGFLSVSKTPTKILLLVYENLVTEPENETKKICDFLGIEWSKQMLKPSKFEHFGEKAITKEEIWYEQKMYNRNPEVSEIDKWKNLLTSKQKMRVFLAFRENDELQKLGYQISDKEISLVARLLGKIEHTLVNTVTRTKLLLKFRKLGNKIDLIGNK